MTEPTQAEALPAESNAAVDAEKKPEDKYGRQLLLQMLNRVLAFLREFPVVAAGAVCTGFGVLVLYVYFRSIEFLPPDLTAIIGAGLAIGLAALGYVVLTILALMAPRWAYLESPLTETAVQDSLSGWRGTLNLALLALQVLGPGTLLGFIAIGMWADCSLGVEYFAVPGVILFTTGVSIWAYTEFRAQRELRERGKRLLWALGVAFIGTLPFIASLAVSVPSSGVSEADMFAWLAVWVVFVVLLAWLPSDFSNGSTAFVIAMLMPAVLVSLPIFLGRPAAFPAEVATKAGIRQPKSAELRVPGSTCDLVRSALASAEMKYPVECGGPGGWGSVRAQVLSNLGSRWWVELSPLKQDESNPEVAQPIRLSIPAEGVQIVQKTGTVAKARNQCGK
jgi:hypothetical protein